MNIASSYGIASGYDIYGTGKISPTSTKPFTIPILDTLDEKTTTQTQKSKNGAVSAMVSSTVSGTVSLHKKCNYDPFKDMAKTGSVNLPEYMQTKTQPKRSDEEILKDIEELAKEHARIGQSSNNDKRFLELMDEYISSVSPDRASILKNEVTEINERLGNEFYGMANSMYAAFQQVNSQKTDKTYEEDKEETNKKLTDFFLEALKNKEKGSSGTISSITKNGDYYTVNVDYGGGKKTILNYDKNGELVSMNLQGNNYFVGGIDISNGAVTSAEIFESNGERTLVFDGNDLSQVYTKAEDERRLEMLAVYNATFDATYGRHLGAINSSNTYKEAYDSTYDRLTAARSLNT